MRRCVEEEWLDALPATDPRAIQSRRDLRRLNAVMQHARFVANAVVEDRARLRRVIDLGGGDGRFLLTVAKTIGPSDFEAVTIDRVDLVQRDETAAQFRRIGWKFTARTGDVFEALATMSKEPGTMILSNLFLHHFDDARLRRLIGLQAQLADVVVACEPRRSRFALLGSHLVGLLGCNAVTRHDAVASVRAGFNDADLTALWHDADEWLIEEKPFGLFSHGFVCRRKER